MQDAHSDHGTVLQSDETALVIGVSGEPKLYMPVYEDDEDVPLLTLLLSAIFVKMGDEDWVNEVIAEFYEEADG